MTKPKPGASGARKKLKPGRGSQKGSAFEREVCKKLSKWITNGKRDDVLWRPGGSGGRATTAAKKGIRMAHVSGDVMAVHPDGFNFANQIFVECKHERDLGLHRWLGGKPSRLMNHWVKAARQAKVQNKEPVLIVKQNGLLPLLITQRPARLINKSTDITLYWAVVGLAEGGRLYIYFFDLVNKMDPHSGLRP